MGKFRSALAIAIIFAIVLIETCSSSDLKSENGLKKSRHLSSTKDNLENTLPADENQEESLKKDSSEIAPEDDMETAENIVFRPLFRYKQQNVSRRRIYKDREGNVLNPTQNPQKPRTPERVPPPILVYDKKTGSYYPMTAPQGFYPGSFQSAGK